MFQCIRKVAQEEGIEPGEVRPVHSGRLLAAEREPPSAPLQTSLDVNTVDFSRVGGAGRAEEPQPSVFKSLRQHSPFVSVTQNWLLTRAPPHFNANVLLWVFSKRCCYLL